jgi:hypothetical protein
MGHSPHRPNRPQICLDVSPNRSDECDDRNPVKEKPMSENAIDSANGAGKPEPTAAKPKRERKAKKAKPAKKAGRANKKAE